MPGDSRKGEGERKEALLKESPGEEGRRAGEDGWSGRSQGPKKKGSLYVIVLELPQCQCSASRACLPPYAATGAGGQDGRPPAGSGPRCFTHPGQPADSPFCQPAAPSSRLSHDPPGSQSHVTKRLWECVVQPLHFTERRIKGPERK